MALDELTYEVLSWVSAGNAVFRPREATRDAEEDFRGMVPVLHGLRAQGLISYLDGHVTQTSSGIYLLVGPVEITPAGSSALEHDRRSGERPPRAAELIPWRS